jgi:hypothetical protein
MPAVASSSWVQSQPGFKESSVHSFVHQILNVHLIYGNRVAFLSKANPGQQ